MIFLPFTYPHRGYKLMLWTLVVIVNMRNMAIENKVNTRPTAVTTHPISLFFALSNKTMPTAKRTRPVKKILSRIIVIAIFGPSFDLFEIFDGLFSWRSMVAVSMFSADVWDSFSLVLEFRQWCSRERWTVTLWWISLINHGDGLITLGWECGAG